MANSIHESYGRPELGAVIDLHPPAEVLTAPAPAAMGFTATDSSVSTGIAAEIGAVVNRSVDAIRSALEQSRNL